MNFKKKLLVGLMSGALILSGGQALANPEMPAHDAVWQEESAHIGNWTEYLTERYGVESAQVEKALQDGVPIEDIRHAAVLSKLSGKNFSEVLAMHVDWQQVAEKLGVTKEQIKEFFQQEREEHFAKSAGIDVKTLRNLLKDGYDPRDIDIAGKIAKASNKNIKSVLEKRRINNTWDDVAKSFGVDLKKIMPPHGERHGQV